MISRRGMYDEDSKKHNLLVIEDIAQRVRVTYKGKELSSTGEYYS